MGTIKAVCVSDIRGIQKKDVTSAQLQVGWGISGDAHGGNWHRQVSLLSYEKVEEFNRLGAEVLPGAFGENLVVAGFDFRLLPVGTKLRCGEALLEITQIGKECHQHCQIYHKMGDCIMPREGVFAKVLHGGTVAVGDEMVLAENDTPPAFRAAIVTLSDKGAAGERLDRSGEVIRTKLSETGYEIVEQLILPDDRAEIEPALRRLADESRVSLILTTGGTGFSARDVTPEATLAVAERDAPGIAEAMRQNSMQITKRAMLSRGVSVIRGKTLIINLPGSPKAVEESLAYILPELEHGLQILLGLTGECASSR
ncbi:MAG: MOSC domain-containing protein [Gracilibacteraceae bacterium]|jgi:molybdenum cofactor synthesis domain-containing protein|nr:MOSC domain-containing protein [Gracilibacteraceae bacterium]